MIADAVSYDISYISKWIGGKMLPSKKSIAAVTYGIAECIANSIDESNELYVEFGVVSPDELKSAVSNALRDAYFESLTKEAGSERTFSAEESFKNLYGKIEKSFYDESDVVALLDIFSFDHESRLLFAAIKQGHFTITQDRPEKDVCMVVSIPEDSPDPVYDSIFLIHLLTSFSRVNMELYHNKAASGKLLFTATSDDGGFSASGMVLTDGTKGTAVSFSNDAQTAGTIKRTLEKFKCPEDSVFEKTTMRSLIEEKAYIKSLLSSNVKWLLGHPTELLLPDDVMEELTVDSEDIVKDEYHRLHILTQSVIEQPNTYILVYESVLSDFVVNGELDFFNTPRVLTSKQRLRCIRYYRMLAETGKKIKLINTGFSSDFSNISNPCLFMSDSFCYLRLENGLYFNNILTVKNQIVHNLFSRFYNNAWLERKDVVIEGQAVIEKIWQYEQAIELLEKIE